MSKLNNKVAVVTGASKGIGASIAKALAAEGAAVVVNYASSKDGAERIVAEIAGKGGKAVAVQGDVAKASDVQRIFVETGGCSGMSYAMEISSRKPGDEEFASHGVLTIGGIVLLTLGGLLLVDSPIPEMRVHLATALAVSIPLGGITAFLMSIALRARRNKVVTGVQGLVGEIGVAQTALSPRGKVFVHGEIWNALSSVPVAAGARIVVRNVSGLELEVAPAPAQDTTPVATPV